MDVEVVRRAQAGDRDAFAELVAGIGKRLQSTADAILREHALAEDAVQRALVAIWRDLPALRDPERFEAWSYRILLNACYAEGRQRRRWMPALPVAFERSAPDPDLDAVVDRDRLERAFRRLSLQHRAVVVLHHYLDLRREEVAEALDIPVGTVHSRLRHAMEALRAALDADERSVRPEAAAKEMVR